MCQYINVIIWRIRAYISLYQYFIYVHAYHKDYNAKDVYIYMHIKIRLAEYTYWQKVQKLRLWKILIQEHLKKIKNI